MRSWLLLEWGIAVLLGAASANAQGTISSGTAQMQWEPVSTVNAADGPMALVTLDGVVQSHQIWFYLGGGATPEFAFPIPDTQAYGGNVATLQWFDLVGVAGLDAELVYTLTSSACGSAALDVNMVILNGGSTPLATSLIAYTDFHMGGDRDDDTAVINPPLVVSDTGSVFEVTMGVTPVAAAFEIGAYRSILAALQDAVPTSFNGGGSPFGPGDFTMATAWALNIPDGDTTESSLLLDFVGPVCVFTDGFESGSTSAWSSSAP